MKVGRIVPVAERPTISESTAGGLEDDSITLDVCRSVMDRAILVPEEEILYAMRLLARRKQWRVEGAAGVALAAFLRAADRYARKNVAVVICGGNLSEKVRNLV
jgi:threonine dehydratase